MAIAIALGALTLGIVFTIIGLRGRRIGDHPYCTACGFDLFGAPPDSERCPECGVNSRAAGSSVIGMRVRRHRPLVSGLALLLPSGGYLAITIAAVAGAINLTGYKPVWWLTSEATSSTPAIRTVAIGELTLRLTANQLSAGNANSVANALLSLQGSSGTWYPECGDLLSTLHAASLLTEKQWKQYAANAAPPLELKVRPRVRLGDPIAYQVKYLAGRVGNKSLLFDNLAGAEVEIAGVKLKQLGGSGSSISNSGAGWRTASVDPDQYAGKLQPGKHHFILKQVRQIKQGYNEKDPVIFTQTSRLEADFELLPADQPSVALINDASLVPGVTASMTAKLTPNGAAGLQCCTEVQHAPVGIAFRVTILGASKPTEVGTIALAAGQVMTIFHGNATALSANQKTASFRYEPDINAAIRTIDVFEMLNLPIQIDEVKPTPW